MDRYCLQKHHENQEMSALTCCPVVDIPVIAWFIYQSVILFELGIAHCVQVALCKKAAGDTGKWELTSVHHL